MKECNTCKKSKNLDSFSKRKASKDGLQRKCKDCVKEYRIKNSKRESKRYRDYRKKGYFNYGSIGWANNALSDYRLSDRKKKQKQCDLSGEEFLNFIENPCSYCGDAEDKIGADRVDNNKGHTKDNIVPCCRLCNTARLASFTYKEMKLIGKTVSKIKKQRRS